jgi:hypothetical protein
VSLTIVQVATPELLVVAVQPWDPRVNWTVSPASVRPESSVRAPVRTTDFDGLELAGPLYLRDVPSLDTVKVVENPLEM